MSNKLESDFQKQLVREIKELLPGCFVFKTDANQRQGFPDLLILYGNRWAALEVKRQTKSSHRMNQDYYVDRLNKMSFARFIYPENKQEVLNELQQSLQPRGTTRLSRCKSKFMVEKK